MRIQSIHERIVGAAQQLSPYEDRDAATIKAVLEILVDKYNLAEVLGYIHDICQEKAATIRVANGDENKSTAWELCSTDIYHCIDKILPMGAIIRNNKQHLDKERE